MTLYHVKEPNKTLLYYILFEVFESFILANKSRTLFYYITSFTTLSAFESYMYFQLLYGNQMYVTI